MESLRARVFVGWGCVREQDGPRRFDCMVWNSALWAICGLALMTSAACVALDSRTLANADASSEDAASAVDGAGNSSDAKPDSLVEGATTGGEGAPDETSVKHEGGSGDAGVETGVLNDDAGRCADADRCGALDGDIVRERDDASKDDAHGGGDANGIADSAGESSNTALEGGIDVQLADSGAADGPNVVHELRLERRAQPTSGRSIMFELLLTNTGASTVSLNEITIRYFFTIQSEVTYDAPIGAGMAIDVLVATIAGTLKQGAVEGFVESLTPPHSKADSYATISFRPDAGSIATNESAGLLIEIHRNPRDQQILNPSNDYSYDSTAEFSPSTAIPVYQNGKLVLGIEPK